MNITLQLQELDELIMQHTTPPVTATLRNKLHPLREQMEAYINSKENEAQQHAELVAEYAKLQKSQQSPLTSVPSDLFEYSRGLYYKANDKIPFCPHCWEADNKKIHLSGPVAMMDTSVEYWECYTCDHDYCAKLGENFTASQARPGRRRRK